MDLVAAFHGTALQQRQARRCYLCNMLFRIDAEQCIYCVKCIDVLPVDCISLTRGALKWSDGRVRFESTTNYNLVDDIVIDHDTCMACKLYLDRANVDRG